MATSKRMTSVGLSLMALASVGVAAVMVGLDRPANTAAAVLHPIERIAYADDWRYETRREGRIGDTVFSILRTGSQPCVPISATGATVVLSQMLPIDIAVSSSEGGTTGSFYEIIVPRNTATCSKSQYVLAEWTVEADAIVTFTIGDATVSVATTVNSDPRRSRPFLIGQSNANLIRGHCPEGYCKREAELGRKYASLFVNHGMQPMQNWVTFPPVRDGRLDLDDDADHGRSFRQLVVQSATSGMIGFPRLRRYPDPVAYLVALENTIKAEGLSGQAWVYAADEPPDLAGLRNELVLYRRYAPSVKVMVTTDYDPSLEGLVDIFAPVFNNLVSRGKPGFASYAGKALWTYVSCMGSCGPNRAWMPNAPKVPGPDTNLADLLIDRPASRLFEFFKVASVNNVSTLFYYEATEGYGLYRHGIDPLVDPWNFGGNGDGLLVFPGRPGEFGLREHTPLASFRLTLLRHALQTYWQE